MSEVVTRCLLCAAEQLCEDVAAKLSLNLAEPHGVMQCADCGFRFLSPRPTRSEYEQVYRGGSGTLADMYPLQPDFYAGATARRINEYRRKLDVLLSHRAGAKGRLLDIGASTGGFLNEGRKRGFDVEGIEPSASNCRAADEQFGLKLRAGRVEDQDFPDCSFDVVFSSHVFEHLLDPLAIAKLIHRWLRPGGLLMIEVPNQFDTLSFRRKQLFGRIRPVSRSFRSIHHTVFFSPRTLKQLAERSGFAEARVRAVRYRSTNPLRYPAAALDKLLAGFGVTIAAAQIELLAHKTTIE